MELSEYVMSVMSGIKSCIVIYISIMDNFDLPHTVTIKVKIEIVLRVI